MESRVYNFSAGPAAIPEQVLREAQQELLNWQGMGVSVMEISHRHKRFVELVESSIDKVRQLLAIPKHYEVLYMSGPSRAQFSAVPLNLLGQKTKAAYIDTGFWSRMALKEGARYAEAIQVVSSEDAQYLKLPDCNSLTEIDSLAYIHYCDNETINGVEFNADYAFPDIVRAVDMTSNIFSKPINVKDYGVIYAGAQKNFGAAGVSLVIIREDLFEQACSTVPTFLNYQTMRETQSLYYTPTTFAIYLADKVFDWILNEGGVEAMAQHAIQKSKLLYDYIDVTDFYSNDVSTECRSRMNIPFRLKDETLNESFIEASENAGLFALKGHRFMGGMRASLYNAMPLEGVQNLISFMQDFEKRHG